MKKQLLLLVALMMAGTALLNAQGPQRRTVEERVQIVHHKMDSTFKYDAAKLAKVDTVFAHYYRSTDKVREELMSGGERPDMTVMREKVQPYMEARDKELKVLMGDDNFKKWKEEIEPTMMRRGPGGGAPRQ